MSDVKMSSQKPRVVLCAGVRTPFVKAGSTLRNVAPEDLGAYVVNDLLAAFPKVRDHVGEVIFGCVGQSSMAPNIARVIQLKTSLSKRIPAYTVARNCSSGLDAVTHAMNQIWLGRSELVMVGGVESMSFYPMRYPLSFKSKLEPLMRAKSFIQKLKVFSKIRPKDLKPINTLIEGLTDPIAHLIMGSTAEVLAQEYDISRQEQDAFAVSSHHKATKAWESGFFEGEVRPVVNGHSAHVVAADNGIRGDSSSEKLAKLKPIFQRLGGSVTVGNASQVTDGAVGLLVASENKAKALGLPIIAVLKDYAFAGCDPKRMGLGPAFATRTLLEKHNMTWKDMDVLEINEAFAAQVLACIKEIAKSEETLGMPNLETLNPNGGAIAMGHPLGASGARLVLTLSRYLQKEKLNQGLASLCIGGGQGGALWIQSVA